MQSVNKNSYYDRLLKLFMTTDLILNGTIQFNEYGTHYRPGLDLVCILLYTWWPKSQSGTLCDPSLLLKLKSRASVNHTIILS